MRKILLVMALLSGWGCNRSEPPKPSPQQKSATRPGEIQSSQLQRRSDGRFYLEGAVRPFTGLAVDRHANGRPQLESRFSNGLKDGPEYEYKTDGQLVARRGWREGRLMVEQLGENLRAAEKVLKERAVRDQNEWKPEMTKQNRK